MMSLSIDGPDELLVARVFDHLTPLADANGWTGATEKTLVAQLDLPTGTIRSALLVLQLRGIISYRVKDGEFRNVRILFEDQQPSGHRMPTAPRGKVSPVGKDALDPRNYPTIAEAGPMTVTKTYHARRGARSPVRLWLQDHGGAGIITRDMLTEWGYSPISAKYGRQLHKAVSRGQITAKSIGDGRWDCTLVGYAPEPEDRAGSGPIVDLEAGPYIRTYEDEPATLESTTLNPVISITLDMSGWRSDEVIAVLRELRR